MHSACENPQLCPVVTFSARRDGAGGDFHTVPRKEETAFQKGRTERLGYLLTAEVPSTSHRNEKDSGSTLLDPVTSLPVRCNVNTRMSLEDAVCLIWQPQKHSQMLPGSSGLSAP